MNRLVRPTKPSHDKSVQYAMRRVHSLHIDLSFNQLINELKWNINMLLTIYYIKLASIYYAYMASTYLNYVDPF